MTHPLPPPADLPPAQIPIWTDAAQRCAQAGTTPDPAHLAAYTAAIHQHQQATQILNQTTPLIERHGIIVPSPLLPVAERTEKRIARLAATLGLTTRTAPPLAGQGAGEAMGAQDDRDLPKLRRWRELHGADPVPLGRWCEEHGRWEGTCHRKDGSDCHLPKWEGLGTCKRHGGRNAQIKHLVAVTDREGGKIGGGPLPGGRELPDIHPADALLYQVRYWAGMTGWLDEVVAGLEQGSMTWGLVRRMETTGGEFPGVALIEQAGLNVWVEWQARAHRLLADVCAKALAAEVDAAALRLQQAQGMQAFRAFQAGLQRLALTAAQWEQARVVMPEVLRALTAA
jgi:Phage terminase, small subunit